MGMGQEVVTHDTSDPSIYVTQVTHDPVTHDPVTHGPLCFRLI